MPCIYFLITGSKHDETIWAGAYHKCDQRRPQESLRFCAILSGSRRSLTQSFKWMKTNSRGTKVEKMLTLAPERYTAGFCMVAKVILWCI